MPVRPGSLLLILPGICPHDLWAEVLAEAQTGAQDAQAMSILSHFTRYAPSSVGHVSICYLAGHCHIKEHFDKEKITTAEFLQGVSGKQKAYYSEVSRTGERMWNILRKTLGLVGRK